MKRFSIFLTALFTGILCTALPVFARPKSDLQTVCNNLSRYFYTPFYNDSEYYDEYEAQLEACQALLDRDDATAAEIDEHYNGLKKAYATLVKDVFDYSSLERLTADFEKLDLSLYEEDSWRNLSTAMEAIYKELDAPTLFEKEAYNKEGFGDRIAKHLNEMEEKFISAYNGLVLDISLEEITAEQLLGLMNYCSVCAPESVMGSSPLWDSYQSVCGEVVALTLSSKMPEQAEITDCATRLLSSYQALSADVLDFSPITGEIERYRSLRSNAYTKASWNRYESAVKGLQTHAEKTYFFYLYSDQSTQENTKHITEYFAAVAKGAKDAFENLVTQESINELSALCHTYQSITAEEGLKNPVEKLQESVKQGFEILEKADATQQEVNDAKQNILDRVDQLAREKQYLQDDLKNSQRNDVGTIQSIITYTVAATVLSLIFAMLASYRRYGRLDWTR